MLPIVLDLPPLIARKREINSIISEYRDAEMEFNIAKDEKEK